MANALWCACKLERDPVDIVFRCKKGSELVVKPERPGEREIGAKARLQVAGLNCARCVVGDACACGELTKRETPALTREAKP